MTVFALLLIVIGGPAVLAQSNQVEKVLIQTPKPYTKIVSDVLALGGKVSKQYQHVDAIAVEIPANAVPALRTLVGDAALSKDQVIPAPRGTDSSAKKYGPLSKSLTNRHARSVTTNSVMPDSDFDPYILNMAGLNLQKLHKQGATGNGIVVAVIDTGIRAGFPVASSVLRCENFVDDNRDGRIDSSDGRCLDASIDRWHGTFVAGLIASRAEFDIAGTDLLTSIQQHAPSALKKNAAGQRTILPLRGSAPQASIYAFRAFGFDSTIIAAIDRIIELRHAGVNIKVCNISLGGATRFPGRDALDRAVDALLENDIVPIVAAGDAGPSALTIASPASSFSALNVGATSPAVNDRISWDMFYGLGSGLVFRPSNSTQIAWFSSRGPNSDGRPDPNVVAAGVGNVGQGFFGPDQIDVFQGTSFSSPIVAGVAAVLRQAHPGSTATQIRNAIISSARPKPIDDGFGPMDRGAGLVDAQAADKLLDSGRVPDFLPRPDRPSPDVRTNIERGTDSNGEDSNGEDLTVVHGTVVQRIRSLKPSQRVEILYNIEDQTSQVVISISNFQASGLENPYLGDDLFLMVHSAKTSQIAAIAACDPTLQLFGDYYDFDGDCYPYNSFVRGGAFVVNDPEPGVMRITISGDYTNGGPVSADVTVTSTRESVAKTVAQGKIDNQGIIRFPVEMPNGVQEAGFELSWRYDWGHFPISDIDVKAIRDPDGNSVDFAIVPAHPLDPIPGLDAPQRVSVIAAPGKTLKKGTWQVVAFGFDIPADTDKLELRVTADGKPLK